MYLQGLGEISPSNIGYVNNTAYGKGDETHSLFKNLQKSLNRYAKLAGFSSLSVDGKLGTLTTSAIKKTLSYIANKGLKYSGGLSGQISFPSIIMTGVNAASSKDYAIYAPELIQILDSAAAQLGAPKATPSLPAITAASPYTSMPIIEDSGFGLSSASLGIGALVLFFLFKNKKRGKSRRERR